MSNAYLADADEDGNMRTLQRLKKKPYNLENLDSSHLTLSASGQLNNSSNLQFFKQQSGASLSTNYNLNLNFMAKQGHENDVPQVLGTKERNLDLLEDQREQIERIINKKRRQQGRRGELVTAKRAGKSPI